jgi:hypothetical protein
MKNFTKQASDDGGEDSGGWRTSGSRGGEIQMIAKDLRGGNLRGGETQVTSEEETSAEVKSK